MAATVSRPSGGNPEEKYAPQPEPPPLPKKTATPVGRTKRPSIEPLCQLIETHALSGVEILEHHGKIFSYAPDIKRAAVEVYGHHIWAGWHGMMEAIQKEVSTSDWIELREEFGRELTSALAIKGNGILHEKIFPRYGIKWGELYEVNSIAFLKNAIANFEDTVTRHKDDYRMPRVYWVGVRLNAEVFSGAQFNIENPQLGLEMIQNTCQITNAITGLILDSVAKFQDKKFVVK